MATLILTTVGSALGGPVGGAIGALIGQQADAALFAPKARRGPRLGELAVQTSSYGTPIPRLFGRMRVAGTVIWATDLKEERASSGGGKGRPRTTSYSYSASFAVALSARAIRGVGRIWADGKLLRGAGGDFKAETGFRLYMGSEDQPVDPLIAAVEGVGGASAFRGIAYALFEDLQLADYGNRIPSLSFEVEADDGAVTIGGMAEELSDGAILGGVTATLAGYAAGGDSVRGAIEALAELAPVSLGEEDGRLRLGASEAPAAFIAAAETGASARGAGGRTEISRRAADAVPGEVSIAYYEPARDWQTGLQRAMIGGAHRSERLALPVALAADAAKAFAEQRLARLRAAGTTATVSVPWRRSGLRPGALVRIEGQSGVWRVERWTLQAMVARLELVQVRAGSIVVTANADAGRPTQEADLPHGATVLRLIELPLAVAGAGGPQLLVAAAGEQPGWRRAALTLSTDDGASWRDVGPTAAPAVIGRALSVVEPRGSALFDMDSEIEVELLNDTMWLESRTDAALAGGANLALLGEELIQFGRAEAIAPRRFRLSRLLRGRRGTEWASGGHAAGEGFVLVEAERLTAIDLDGGAIGGEARLLAHGIGDGADGVAATRVVSGEAVRPPTPVHLKVIQGEDGALLISWVRRSRGGWTWSDAGDAPLAEESERYRLRLSGTGFDRALLLDAPGYSYSAEAQASDGGGPLTIDVAQVGTFATSQFTTLIVERP